MLKIRFVILLSLFVTSAYSQVSFTYTFDSSVLSVLLGKNEIMNAAKPKLVLDIKHRWRYTQADSVHIDIRGFYGNNQIDSTSRQPIRIKYRLFQSRYTEQLQPGSFVISKVVSVRSIRKRPSIKITATVLQQREKDNLVFDSFDFMAEPKKTP